MSEELAVYINRDVLKVKKYSIKNGVVTIGEYIYVKHGLFEAEAEYDVEDGVLYYLQICWLNKCVVFYDGEPDHPLSPAAVRRAWAIFGELASWSQAAKATLRVLASYIRRSSPIGTSNPTHRRHCQREYL